LPHDRPIKRTKGQVLIERKMDECCDRERDGRAEPKGESEIDEGLKKTDIDQENNGTGTKITQKERSIEGTP